MNTIASSILRSSLVALLVAGCSSSSGPGGVDAGPADADGSGSSDGIEIQGPIIGDNVPEEGKVLTVWDVKTADPDREYKSGEGTSRGSDFSVTLHSAPPPAALNDYGVGVGFAVLVPPTKRVPEGDVTDPNALEIQGLSDRHAVIYKTADSSGGPAWAEAFPTGYSCGACAPGAGLSEVFEPVACSELEVRAPSDLGELEVCLWAFDALRQ